MVKTLSKEQAVELGQIISAMHDVDFENGEGKVIVFDNAVLILSQDEDGPEQLQAQLVVSKYERVEAKVETGINWERMIDDLLG